MACYRKGGCGSYQYAPCNECPASKPEYGERYTQNKKKNDNKRQEEMHNDELNAFCQEVEKNIADEATARQGYYSLLLKFSYMLTDQEIKDFKEIIAEELKHSQLLSDMIESRNGIFPEQ